MDGITMDSSAVFEKECFHGDGETAHPHSPHPHRLNPRTNGQNRLLGALPAEVYQRLEGNLERVRMEHGGVLHENGEPLRHIYFPTDCMVTLLCELDDGATGEIAVVGNEGLVSSGRTSSAKRFMFSSVDFRSAWAASNTTWRTPSVS